MSDSIIIDIVCAVLSAIIVIRFTVKGFLSSVLDTFKVFFSILIAYLIRLPIAKIFDSAFMNKAIVGWVKGSLEASASGNTGSFSVVSIHEKVPVFFNWVLTDFGYTYADDQLINIENADAIIIEDLSINIGNALSSFLSTLMAVLVVFIIALIVLSLVSKLLNYLTKIALFNILNRLLGLALGVALSACLLWGVSIGIIWLTNNFGHIAPSILNEDTINKSMIIGLFKNLDLIEWVKGLF